MVSIFTYLDLKKFFICTLSTSTWCNRLNFVIADLHYFYLFYLNVQFCRAICVMIYLLETSSLINLFHLTALVKISHGWYVLENKKWKTKMFNPQPTWIGCNGNYIARQEQCYENTKIKPQDEILFANFAKFTKRHLCRSFFFNKAAGLRPEVCNYWKMRLRHRHFPVNFVKFFRTSFLKITFGWLLLSAILWGPGILSATAIWSIVELQE